MQLLIIALSLIVLLPQIKSLAGSLDSSLELNLNLLLLASGLVVLSYVFAGLVYVFLLPHRLRVRRTVLIQFATGFTGRIVPGGLGALGLSALYLAKQLRMTKTSAATYAGINNVLGFLAFSVVTVLVVLVDDSTDLWNLVSSKGSGALLLAVIIIGFLFLISALLFPVVKRQFLRILRLVRLIVKHLANRPGAVALALLMSIGIAACNIGVLYLSIEAAGQSLPVTQLVLVFGAGIFAIAVSPTPGGLGAAEAIMAVALGWAGQSPAEALSIVLAFRLLTYWLPILPGYLAFRYVSSKKFI